MEMKERDWAGRFVWPPCHEFSSAEDLSEFHDRNSIHGRVPGPYSGWAVAVVVPVALYLVGVLISAVYGMLLAFISKLFPYLFTIDLIIALGVLMWGDRRIARTIIQCEPAFDMTDEEYYRFFGRMLERVYEHLPYMKRPEGHHLHVPTITLALMSYMGFAILVAIPDVQVVMEISGWRWSELPIPLGAYLLALLLLGLTLGIVYVWPIVVAVVYLGVKVQELPIRLHFTREHDRLGLLPFARLILQIHFGYLLLLTVSGLLVFRRPGAFVIAGFALMTALPIIGYLASQYGLHVAIIRSKQRWLDKLRSEHDRELEQWFNIPEKGEIPDAEIRPLITAKEEIQSLPEWPVNQRYIIELISTSVAANAVVLLRVFIISIK